MTVSFPKVSIAVGNDQGTGTQGEINVLSLGFGIHQSWILAAQLGMVDFFQAQPSGLSGALSIPLAFLVSVIAFGITLLIIAGTDQKFLKHYTDKRSLVAAAILTSLGTLCLFATGGSGSFGFAMSLVAGVATGIGSALLIVFWGTAFSRHGSATIVMNTAVAVVMAVILYSFIFHGIPSPYAGLIICCLPLFELPFLWQLTPVSYSVRHVIPIFSPLPVRKASFSVRLAVPTLLFGFALGVLRSVSVQVILPASDLSTQLIILFAGGTTVILLVVASFCMDEQSHWDFLFRPLVPLVALSLFFLPTASSDTSLLGSFMLLAGFMCLEVLMWVFFCELAQEFRLSPIFVFSMGRCCLAVGASFGVVLMAHPQALSSFSKFGEFGGVALIMFVMIAAFAFLPRVRDIKRIVARSSESTPAIDSFNLQAERMMAGSTETGKEQAWQEAYASTGAGTLGPAEQAALRSGSSEAAAQASSFAGNATSGNAAGTLGSSGAATGTSQNGMTSMGGKTADGETANRAGEVSGTRAGGTSTAGEATAAGGSAGGEAEPTRKSGRFRTQCETIANRYLLSRRETEVMFLLAKGYNAAYIQDKLCISKSTAKTHIGHIYRKLNIHNQQELLLMIEDASNTSSGTK